LCDGRDEYVEIQLGNRLAHMIRYVELKSGYHDDGPAWIARVLVSKPGRTVYFNGKALKDVAS
jgi:hypothetical protein